MVALDEHIVALRTRLAPLLSGKVILEIRSGYHFKDGWITDEAAIVVVVAQASELSTVSALAGAAVGGLPVDVILASAFDLLEAAAPKVGTGEAVPRIRYSPPVGFGLTECLAARVICHASPDAGWTTLEKFLRATSSNLTVGMYDFTATHIREVVAAALGTHGTLKLILQRGQAPLTGAKRYDITDDETVEALREALDERFEHEWASVSGPRRVFASAYHLKVAVQDGRRVWLSSGNWQTSNQPPIDPVGNRSEDWAPLLDFNREWHVVLESPELAEQFETHLLHDIQQARDANELAEAYRQSKQLRTTAAPLSVQEPPRYFGAREVERVRVQPLLTPDNYREHVLELLREAEHSILFQNQSLSLLTHEKNEPAFEELVGVLLEKQRELPDVRIIIRGDFAPRTPLERLKKFGFDMRKVRCQNRCHTKGLVIDGKIAVVGSHNWTNQGVLANRDASVIIHDAEVAAYFATLFEFDWTHLAQARLDLSGGEGAAADPEWFSLDEVGG